MTYEPNWFAEQIAFLLMPWLFTAVFSKFTVFRRRWRWVTVESIMLVWAAGVLIFTFSRAGLILLAVQLFLIFIFRPRLQQTDSSHPNKESKGSGWKTIGKRVFQAGFALVVLLGVVIIVGSRNNYFSRLWNYWTDEESTGEYLQYIAFDQRFTYWETAYKVYNEFPWLGVGLGNYTFYFSDYLADRPLYPTPELLTALVPEEGRSQVTTVKSIFPRLLAETGITGMGTFLAFLLALLGCAIFLWRSNNPEAQFWGRAGLLGLIIFLVVSFSYDSFSLPNMWVIFGLITAATQTYINGET